MKLQLSKLLIFLSIFALLPTMGTNARYQDIESSINNQLSATTLDFELTGSGFDEENLTPASIPSASITMNQAGDLDFDYTIEFAKTAGDDLLCNNAVLTVSRDTSPIYSGPLSDFNLSSIPFSGSNVWDFEITIPNDPAYQLLSCDFDFVISSDDPGFSDTETVSNHITTTDWTAPTASLSITGSWTKIVSEKIENGEFDNGLAGWTTAGDVSIDGSVAQIGSDDEIGGYVWENRLMQAFPSGAKNLSLWYNFYTRDFTPADDPGFLVRLNGNQAFTLNTLDANLADELDFGLYSTGWQQAIFDLSGFTTSNIELSLNSGNTGDRLHPSWTQVDHISTWFVAAPAYATYTLSGSEDIDHFVCTIDGEDDCQLSDQNQFQIITPGTHIIEYYAVDMVGNESDHYQITIVTDDIPPADIFDLIVEYTTENSALLSWTAPGNDGFINQASKYELRYQKDCSDINSFNFYQASKFEGLPTPLYPGILEEFMITGLSSSTDYCFAIKTADEAPNWSGASNVVTDYTLNSMDYVHTGDIVINELMWQGSSISSADEWLELRNMTDHDLKLDYIYITGFNGSDEEVMDIDLTGRIIPARGYFLIANNNEYTKKTIKYDSQLNIGPDVWDTSIELDEDNLQIGLYYQLDTEKNFESDILLDVAWDKTEATQGLNKDGKYYSMERTGVPGDGDNPLSWYTCTDPETTQLYFDNDADERGTPGNKNSSQEQSSSYEPEISLRIEGDEAYFTVHHVAEFVNLSYTLIYDTDTVPQGAIGTEIITQDTFEVGPIDLASCSEIEGKVVCTSDPNPHNFVLEVELEDIYGNTINLSDTQ